MQITNSQKRRVAIFFIFGITLFLTLVAVLVGNKILKREDCYFTKFKDISVAGLTEGSSVKFQGMNIGAVSAISIDQQDTAIVRIDFCVNPGVPMKDGTFSQLGNIGITGLKFLELKGGGTGKNIPINGEVPSSESTWDTITGKAEVIAEKLELILNNINNITKEIKPATVTKITENIAGISTSVNTILNQNKDNIRSIVSRTDELLANINSNMDNISKITGDVAKMTGKDGQIQKTLNEFAGTATDVRTLMKDAKLEQNITKVFTLIDSMQKTMDTVNLTLKRSQENITDSMENLSEGMENFSEFTRILMENPSAILKGNSSEGK